MLVKKYMKKEPIFIEVLKICDSDSLPCEYSGFPHNHQDREVERLINKVLSPEIQSSDVEIIN